MPNSYGIEELRGVVGGSLGTGEWLEIDQARIDAFAAATEDHQWIHVDPERAERGPYGTTIAHGYLTLSLVPHLVASAYEIEGVEAKVNYGSDRVRFPAPVPCGSRLRAHVELVSLEDVPGGAQMKTRVTVEREGAERPVLVAEPITRLSWS